MSPTSKNSSFLMSVGCFFGTCFEAPKNSQKKVSRPPIWSFWCPNALQSDPREAPKGSQNPSKISTKSSPSRRGHPPAPFEAKKWSPEAGTPSKSTEKHKKTEHTTRRRQQKTQVKPTKETPHTETGYLLGTVAGRAAGPLDMPPATSTGSWIGQTSLDIH